MYSLLCSLRLELTLINSKKSPKTLGFMVIFGDFNLKSSVYSKTCCTRIFTAEIHLPQSCPVLSR